MGFKCALHPLTQVKGIERKYSMAGCIVTKYNKAVYGVVCVLIISYLNHSRINL